ncbi:hypothetical protein KM043_017106 [Ampulex compressa]|nr:hypothetical protein KM043_017106 [Ampulex compressa]
MECRDMQGNEEAGQNVGRSLNFDVGKKSSDPLTSLSSNKTCQEQEERKKDAVCQELGKKEAVCPTSWALVEVEVRRARV